MEDLQENQALIGANTARKQPVANSNNRFEFNPRRFQQSEDAEHTILNVNQGGSSFFDQDRNKGLKHLSSI